MSSPDRTSRLRQRRRRRERIAGAALAVLGVAVLVVAVIAIQRQHDRGVAAGTRLPSSSSSHHPAATRTATRSGSVHASPSRTASSVASARQPLVVLNNTTVAGLAKSAARRFEAGGWTVTTFDNYQNDIISTCAYYDPDVAGAKAAALALQRQFPEVKRVEPQFSQLSAWHSPIVVILTPDYAP
jgi:hypothetical protein